MRIDVTAARTAPKHVLQLDGESVAWWPFVLVGNSGTMLGVSAAGEWVVGNDVGVRADSVRGRVGLLPLLGRHPDEVLPQVRDAVQSLGLHPNAVDALCIADIVRTALTVGSLYWAEHSLDWIVALSLQGEVRDLLVQAVAQPWASQAFRHRAQRLLVIH